MILEIPSTEGAPVKQFIIRNESGDRVNEVEVGNTLYFEEYLRNDTPSKKNFQIELSVVHNETKKMIFYENYEQLIEKNSKELIKWQVTPILPGYYISQIIVPEVINSGGGFEATGHFAPMKQLKFNVQPYEVYCKENLNLIFKSSDNSPACVKPESIPKLIERGWALENSLVTGLSIYSLTDSEKGDFEILYSLIGADLVQIKHFFPANSLIINLENSSEGSLTIHVPRDLIDAWIGDEPDDFFVIVNGEEVDFEEIPLKNKRILEIEFPKDTTEIEIITTSVL